MIYVPRELFIGVNCRLYPDWVSNGHFLIHRSIITNGYDFANEEDTREWVELWSYEDGLDMVDGKVKTCADESSMREVWDGLVPHPYTLTNQCIELSGVYSCPVGVILQPTEQADDAPAFLDRRLVDALNLQNGSVWYSRGNTSPFFDAPQREKVRMILMPLNPNGFLEKVSG